MTDQHCPGFETNKTLAEVKIKCPDCGKEFEVFSDETDKHVKCPGCNTMMEPKDCVVDS